jgi:hypothetical protein
MNPEQEFKDERFREMQVGEMRSLAASIGNASSHIHLLIAEMATEQVRGEDVLEKMRPVLNQLVAMGVIDWTEGESKVFY